MIEYFIGYGMGQRSAARAASLARSAAVANGTHHTNRIEDLNERIDKLLMIVRGMWALMEEQGMTAEHLMAKIDEIDLQDGTDDGQVRSQIVECPSCQSKVAPIFATASYAAPRCDPTAGTRWVRSEPLRESRPPPALAGHLPLRGRKRVLTVSEVD